VDESNFRTVLKSLVDAEMELCAYLHMTAFVRIVIMCFLYAATGLRARMRISTGDAEAPISSDAYREPYDFYLVCVGILYLWFRPWGWFSCT